MSLISEWSNSIEVEGGEPDPNGPDPTWTLTVSVQGQGSVGVNPDKLEYDDNEQVTLTATPNSGWAESDPLWTGANAPSNPNENPTVITMDTDKALVANFYETVEPDPDPDPPNGVRELTVSIGSAHREAWVVNSPGRKVYEVRAAVRTEVEILPARR
jgi:hypothetical protein